MNTRAGAIAFLILLSALIVGVTNAFAAAPTLTVDPGATAAYASAEVSGTIDPAGNEVFYYFQYSREPATEGWTWGSQQSLPAGSGSTPVSGRLIGLNPATEYQVRLIAFPADFSTEWTSEPPYVTFETKPVGAPTITIDPATLNGGSVQLTGSINPNSPEAAPASTPVEEGFKVDWHFECTPECPGLSGGTVAADKVAHPVTATSAELEPNTHYEATLVGANASGPTTAGPISFSTGASVPRAETVPAFAFGGGTRASLGGRVDARNSPTDYWFEYGPTVSYGQMVPAAPVTAGSGRETFVTQQIAGLTPSTIYHYRLVAENAAGRDVGGEMTFETAPVNTAVQQSCPNAILRAENDSDQLPGCRAYEMVSPLDKNGYDIGLGPLLPAEVAAASSSTPGIAYQSFGALPGAKTAVAHNYYLSRRGPNGWNYDPLSPPIYPVPNPGEWPAYRLFSRNLDRAYINNRTAGPSLAPGDFAGTSNAYVRDNTTNTYQALNVGSPIPFGRTLIAGWETPDGSRVIFESDLPLVQGVPEGRGEVYEWSEGRIQLVSVLPDGSLPAQGRAGGPLGLESLTQPYSNIISSDGSRVFFGTNPGFEENAAPALYVRIDGSHTEKVAEAAGIEYLGASTTGSVVYFKSGTPLTPEAGNSNLYRFDLDTKTLIDLAPPLRDDKNAPVPGVLGMSDDGAYVYFYDEGKILPDGPKEGIYEWHAGELTLVSSGGSPGNLVANLTTARVTPDGQHLVFTTAGRVTAYDSAGATEVYGYDASTARLTCMSCRLDGHPPVSGASTVGPPGEDVANPQRSISADGQRVFFNTAEALVPGDNNNRLDVYAWENGLLHLISSGTDGSESYFSGASENGDDVYFVTRSQLVPGDTDENTDIYDARVDGGFPADTPSATCSGEQCQGPSTVPLPMGDPGSGTLQGLNAHKASKARVSKGKKLRRAIKSCKRKHHGEARRRCIAKARKRYGKGSKGRKK